MEIKTIEKEPKKFYQEQSSYELGKSIYNLGNKALLNVVQDISVEVQKQKEVEYNNSLMDLATEGNMMIQDYKNKHSLDPNNMEARDNLLSELNASAEYFLNEVPTSKRNEAKRQVSELLNKARNDLNVWGFEQSYKNGLESIDKQIKELNNNAVSYGMMGDITNATTQLELMGDNIRKNAAVYMGEEKAEELTKGLVKDYYTSFFGGMLETHPEQVLKNIDDPNIINLLGKENADKFRNTAKTKMFQIQEYSIQKDLADLMIKESDVLNAAINGDLDIITFNNFIERNRKDLHKSTIDYLAKKGGYDLDGIGGSSGSSKSSKEKPTFQQKIEAESEIETKLTLYSVDPTKFSIQDLRDTQNKVFEYANDGLLGESKAREYTTRIKDYATQVNFYKTENEYLGALENQKDERAEKLLKYVNDISVKNGWYKTNSKGEFVESKVKDSTGLFSSVKQNKNILGNNRIIENKAEVNNLLNVLMSTYNENKTNNLVELARSKGQAFNDYNTPLTFYGTLNKSEKARIQKLAYDKATKDINDGLGIDTTNKTPLENEENLNNYIFGKIQETNDLIIEEQAQSLLNKERNINTGNYLMRNWDRNQSDLSIIDEKLKKILKNK